MRVGHFEPETITVVGEGVFQRITLSLPRDEEIPKYEKLRSQAQDNLMVMAGDPTSLVGLLFLWNFSN